MLIPTLIMTFAAIILLYIGYTRGEGEHIAGLKFAFNLLLHMLPILLAALIVAGMVQTLIPQEKISRWVGEESGIRGVIIGCIAGALTPGGPYICFGIVAGIAQAGASIGTLVAYVTAWSLYAVARLPIEAGVLGFKFIFMRLTSVFLFPPLAGIIANLLFKGMKIH